MAEATCPKCGKPTIYGRDIDGRTGEWLGEKLCMNSLCEVTYFKVGDSADDGKLARERIAALSTPAPQGGGK